MKRIILAVAILTMGVQSAKLKAGEPTEIPKAMMFGIEMGGNIASYEGGRSASY